MINVNPEALLAAHNAGKQCIQNLKVGDIFKGCHPAAIAAGYKEGTPEYSMFLYSALDECAKYELWFHCETNKLSKILPRKY
jgi:hypothetical protein